MISLHDITLSFGGRALLDEISFTITRGDRIGLVGRNGAGKSTLLRLLTGKMLPDSGNITKPADCTMGFLEQEPKAAGTETVFEETFSSLEKLRETHIALEKLTHQLETRTDYDSEDYHKLIDKQQELVHSYEMQGGSKAEGQVEKILLGLGFERESLHKPLKEFSGGWVMRVELAKILLNQPDLILLDEPTNHLDIHAIRWLEQFIVQSKSTLILISHDRAFLDAVTNRTVEIIQGHIQDYKMPYSKYIEARKLRMELQMNEKKNQDREIRRTEVLIDKFRYKASKASFAQSLIKKLDKMDIIEIDEEDVRAMHFRFPAAPRSGGIVLHALDVTKKYGEKTIFSHAEVMVMRGEKVAFVGRNGEGKTTFTRLVNGEEKYEGNIKTGTNVSVGYFAQHQAEKLDPEMTVLETLDSEAVGDVRKKLRTLLGAFLFSGDDVEKKVRVLSGGEKARLALARLLLSNHNLLILDEPTNHLDMLAKDVLKEALTQFDGAVILVSHDRDFLRGLTERSYAFHNGEVKEYKGTIDEFIAKYDLEQTGGTIDALLAKPLKTAAAKAAKPVVGDNTNNGSPKKNNQKELQQINRKIGDVEKKISQSEHLLQALEQRMSNPYSLTADELGKISDDYAAIKKKLEALMSDWEKLGEEKEALSAG